MAIHTDDWATGEKITSVKLNNMLSNEINSTDNIHPQYRHTEISMAGTSNAITHAIYNRPINPGGYVIVSEWSQSTPLDYRYYDSRWTGIAYNSTTFDVQKRIAIMDFIKTVNDSILNLHFYGKKVINAGPSHSFYLHYILFSGQDNGYVTEGDIEITESTYTAGEVNISIADVPNFKNLRLIVSMRTLGISNDASDSDHFITNVRATIS